MVFSLNSESNVIYLMWHTFMEQLCILARIKMWT
jgi:hypothetical protein